TLIWHVLDNATTAKELTQHLSVLISNSALAAKIHDTVKSVGLAIQTLFKNRLCLDFMEITKAQIIDFMGRENSLEWQNNKPIHLAVLNNTLFGSKNSNHQKDTLTHAKIIKMLHEKGAYNLTPLHIA